MSQNNGTVNGPIIYLLTQPQPFLPSTLSKNAVQLKPEDGSTSVKMHLAKSEYGKIVAKWIDQIFIIKYMMVPYLEMGWPFQ